MPFSSSPRAPREHAPSGAHHRSRLQQIRRFYRILAASWGPQHWWPAETRLEVIVGAYLTQNTSWTNVERALGNLRRAEALTLSALREIPVTELQRLIRPAGYFRQKAQRLKTFVAFLDTRYCSSLERMFSAPTGPLRQELLGLNGVGPETADSILLYAGDHPVFVVDAYARRIIERHGIMPANSDYETIRALFEGALRDERRVARPQPRPAGKHPQCSALPGAAHLPSAVSAASRALLAQLYNEMHALIVGVGKHFCLKSESRCAQCPLRRLLPSHPASRAVSAAESRSGPRKRSQPDSRG